MLIELGLGGSVGRLATTALIEFGVGGSTGRLVGTGLLGLVELNCLLPIS